jgi:hypothetical protein
MRVLAWVVALLSVHFVTTFLARSLQPTAEVSGREVALHWGEPWKILLALARGDWLWSLR